MKKQKYILIGAIVVFAILIVLVGLFVIRVFEKKSDTNGLTWKVEEVKDLGEIMSANPPFDSHKICRSNNGKILYIKITVQNSSEKTVMYYNDTPLVVDSLNTYYPVGLGESSDYTNCIDGDTTPLAANIGSFPINPGSEVDFALIYDVPQDVDSFSLKFENADSSLVKVDSENIIKSESLPRKYEWKLFNYKEEYSFDAIVFTAEYLMLDGDYNPFESKVQWNPTESDLYEAEEVILQYLENKQIDDIDLSDYSRQYLGGFTNQGEMKLFIIFIDETLLDSGEYYSLAEYSPIFFEDGGNSFFTVMIDFETMTIEELTINGES
ncbi:MAG: DUF4352 domain-containing protein [Candidatus Pacebacteria bacterium]|nr:DUF4352 domain-containing protein [Candidatus Paceibacterota bacterium]